MSSPAPPGRILATALALSAIVAAQPVAAVVPMLTPGSAFEVADGVYVIPDNDIPLVPNVGIVVGREKVLVVDTGMGPANAEIVLAEVRRLTELPIAYLVSTHFHPEHYFGAQSFPASTRIVIPAVQARDLAEKGAYYKSWFVDMFGDDVRDLLAPVELRRPDVTFDRRVELDLGGRTVEIHHFGRAAHTRGDTVVRIPDVAVVFTGGLTPNGKFPIMPDPDSSGAGWIASLDRLRALEFDRLVPGHGKVGGRDLIDPVDTYLHAVRDRVGALRAAGSGLDVIKTTLTDEFVAAHPDWTEPFWIGEAAANFYRETIASE